MPRVVSDTSPIYYLFAIGQPDLLSHLFGTVLIPHAVDQELRHPTAPVALRNWIEANPHWLKIASIEPRQDQMLDALGDGEREAILLADSIQATLLLIDERKGTKAAIAKGLHATGTLGILRLAARNYLLDLSECITKLQRTNFRYRQETLDALLKEMPDNK